MFEDSHLESVYEDAYAGISHDGYENESDDPEWYCPECDVICIPNYPADYTEDGNPICQECGTELDD